MGYDQYTVPDTNCGTYFFLFAFLSTRKQTSMASCAILSNFFEEQWTQNHPHTFRGYRAHFSDNLSGNSCINHTESTDPWSALLKSERSNNLRKQLTSRDATTGFIAKWRRAQERTWKFYTDDVALLRSGWCLWLVKANVPRSATNQKHWPHLGSDTSAWKSFRGESCVGCAQFSHGGTRNASFSVPQRWVQMSVLWGPAPIPGGTPYDDLSGEAPPESGIFFSLQVYERVGISLVKVYKKVGKSVIWVCIRAQKG